MGGGGTFDVRVFTTVFNFTLPLGIFHQEKTVFRLPSIIPYMVRQKTSLVGLKDFVFLKYRSSSTTDIA